VHVSAQRARDQSGRVRQDAFFFDHEEEIVFGGGAGSQERIVS
jgi:hypothetical protein